jgi:hypothetical protein
MSFTVQPVLEDREPAPVEELEQEVGDDDVAARGESVGHRLGGRLLAAQPLELARDLLLAQLDRRRADGEAVVAGGIEVGDDLEVELDGQRSVLPRLQVLVLQGGGLDRVEVVLLDGGPEGILEQAAGDLGGELLAVALLEDLPRRLSGAEALHPDPVLQVSELVRDRLRDLLRRHPEPNLRLRLALRLDLERHES